jgi:valyl-tRNA synthetase
MISAYPKSLPRDHQAEEEMSYIIDAVMGIRTIRGELNISPSLNLSALIKTSSRAAEKVLRDNIHYIKTLAKADRIEVGADIRKPDGAATAIKGSFEVYVNLQGVLNIASEIDRLKREKAKVDTTLVALNRKLFNEDFLQKAPKDIIEKEKAKHEELMKMRDKITDSIKMLKEAEVK